MVKRYLVTTALEETWPEENIPVLFLGEWCRLYDRKAVWEARDAVVAPYHWDNREKLHQDYEYIQCLYEELLVELVEKLNTLHDVNHSVRYWRIIVGPWLSYFIQMLFDRWFMLRQVIHDHNIVGVRVLIGSDYRFVPNNFDDFESLYVCDVWNEMIYAQLLALTSLPIEYVDAVVPQPDKDNLRLNNKVKRTLLRFTSDTLNNFVKEDESVFISSYLKIKQDLLLQFKLGQVPKIWQKIATPKIELDTNMRKWNNIKPENVDDFLEIVRSLIPMHIPLVYLEGYQKVLTLTSELHWPKRPNVIFTSNSFSSDDTFKVWAAEKVELGTPLVIGQHGGHYGIGKWDSTEDHQIAICDHFLSWGWETKGQKKITPIGNLKGFGTRGVWDKQGFALLIENSVPRFSYRMYSVPVAGQLLEYFEYQYRFVEALPQMLRDQVIVRLYPSDYGWSLKRRWRDRFPMLQLDDGRRSVASLIMKSRLCISTYNATTYLESMSQNIPTLIFWNLKHWELRDSAFPYIEKLKAVGILHETPESAAKQMTLVWNDVSSWWESQEVQSVRKEFCGRYAHIPEKPLDVMAKLFSEIKVGLNI